MSKTTEPTFLREVESCRIEMNDRMLSLAEAHQTTFTTTLATTVMGEMYLLWTTDDCSVEDLHDLIESLRPTRRVGSASPSGSIEDDSHAAVDPFYRIPVEDVPPDEALFEEFFELKAELAVRYKELVIVAAFAKLFHMLLERLAADNFKLADAVWQALRDGVFSQVPLNG
jgi:hypothetical protein